MRRAHSSTVFTVGHSNHSIERFEELLHTYGVTAVADVRSAPYSRFSPQFNKEDLAAWLRDAGIAYVFWGHELGGRSDDPSDYENGRVRYDRLAAKPTFESGIERVLHGASEKNIALLCAEKEPLDCHRTLLVARSLTGRGVGVEHILADGSLESHDQTMVRLLEMTGLKQTRLFDQAGTGVHDALDAIAEAIALRAAQVGHTRIDRSAEHESRRR